MKRVISSNWLVPFVLFFFLVLTFYRLPQTFFQQDEWRAFGIMAITEQNLGEGIRAVLPKTPLEHLAPLSFLLEFLQFKLFRLNFPPYALVSLSFHFFNALLVYYFLKLISQNRTLGLLGSLLFITNSLSHQATTWMSPATSSQGATLFVLISLILFFKYLKGNQDRAKFLFFSLVSFFVSLMFKESSIFLFIFLPIFWFLFAKEKSFPAFKKLVLPLFFVFFLYMLFRGLFLFNNFGVESIGFRMETGTTIRTPANTYIYRIAELPFKALPQSFFTTSFLVTLSRNLVLIAYPHWLVTSGSPNPFVVESIALDYINFILSILIFIFALFIYKLLKKFKDEKAIKLLVFSLVFIVASYLPFIFIQGVGGFISIAEPRNLYIPNIGSSIFLALSIMTFSSLISKKMNNKYAALLIIVFLFLLISSHIKIIRQDLRALDDRSKIRVNILKTIFSSFPNLPEKIIFYTESDTSYYGLPLGNNILPFQSGFGRTLLVWYYSNGQKVPKCFFDNDWLYHLDRDQDYKYCQGRGFGYFRKIESLKEALKTNNLLPENVIAFSWNSKNNQFTEITPEIRKLLGIMLE